MGTILTMVRIKHPPYVTVLTSATADYTHNGENKTTYYVY